MRNRLLVVTLFISVCVCAAAADYVYTDAVYESRENERARYAMLGADPHGLYGGYTVDELAAGYSPPRRTPGAKILDVPVISQFPELPVGCEITAATALLNYLGFDVDKAVMASDFLKSENSFTLGADGISRGPDPYKVFAGDPFGWGYGCFAPVIEDALNSYFHYAGSGYRAAAIYGLNAADMEKLLDRGVPLIVWASRGMNPFNYREPAEWIIHGTGVRYEWLGNSHTLVLCGYDGVGYYFMDPDDKTELEIYAKDHFLRRFGEAGSQAVVVMKN